MRNKRALVLAIAMLAWVAVAQAQDLDKTTKKLVDQLDHREASRRQEAAVLLGKIKAEAAVPALIVALEDGDWIVRSAAAGALWRIGSPAADSAKPALETRLLTDEVGKVRVNSAGALWRLGASTKELIPHLRPVLDDESAIAQVDAADMLLDMRVDPAEVLPTLERNMKSGQKAVRERVIDQFFGRSPLTDEFEPLLIAALDDSEWSIRLSAAMLLSNVEGEASPQALAALKSATNDKSKDVRNAAQEALNQLTP